MLGLSGSLGALEALRGSSIRGGSTFLVPLLAPGAAAVAISLLNQRDEAAGGQGSLVRSAGIGAGALAAASFVPAMQGVPTTVRLAGTALVGAAVGTFVHTVSASSRD